MSGTQGEGSGVGVGILFDRLLQLDGKVALHYGVVGTVSKVKMDENFSWVSFLSVENLFLRQFLKTFLGALNFNMTFELGQGPLEYKPKNTAQLFGGNYLEKVLLLSLSLSKQLPIKAAIKKKKKKKTF